MQENVSDKKHDRIGLINLRFRPRPDHTDLRDFARFFFSQNYDTSGMGASMVEKTGKKNCLRI